MRQVIFRIPVPGLGPEGIPIYGYGLMLFVAFIACTWLAGRRAQREGIAREHIQDLAIWLFVGGLLVSRFTYLIQDPTVSFPSWEFVSRFPRIWDGGVILYGAVIGGLIGYALAYVFIVRKHHLSGWKLADIVAPSIALGVALGRVGCLLNGCCYGHVACPHCPHVSFPLSAPPRFELVAHGYQTAAGFAAVPPDADPRTVAGVDPASPTGRAGLRPGDIVIAINDRPIVNTEDLKSYLKAHAAANDLTLVVLRDGAQVKLEPFRGPTPDDFQTIEGVGGRGVDGRVVGLVEPGSAAAEAGLEKWDRIIRADGRDVASYDELSRYLGSPHAWPRGQAELTLTVVKSDTREQTLSFVPWTIGLHPTQVYETVSMFLVFLLLTAYYPLRRHDGEVMALLMICYSVHRYLNELLRSDVRPVGFEKWASVALLAAGVGIFLWRRFGSTPQPVPAKAS